MSSAWHPRTVHAQARHVPMALGTAPNSCVCWGEHRHTWSRPRKLQVHLEGVVSAALSTDCAGIIDSWNSWSESDLRDWILFLGLHNKWSQSTKTQKFILSLFWGPEVRNPGVGRTWITRTAASVFVLPPPLPSVSASLSQGHLSLNLVSPRKSKGILFQDPEFNYICKDPFSI